MRIFQKEDIESQLNRVTEQQRFRSSQQNDLRKLSITVWLAMLVAIASNKLGFNHLSALFLLAVPSVMFFVMDAIHGVNTIRLHDLICSLEGRLAKEDFKSDNPIEIYNASTYAQSDISKKNRMCRFLKESELTWVLYICQIIISVVVAFCIMPT